MIFLGIKQFLDPYYQGVAAQVAFFFILSIVPTLMLLTQLLGLFGLTFDGIMEWFATDLGPDANALLSYVFDARPQATTSIILLIMAVWAASRIQFTLMRVTAYTMSEGRDPGRFWRDRFRSMGAVLVTIVAVVGVIVVMIYGEIVFRRLLELLQLSGVLDQFWSYLRFPIAGGLYFLVVSLNYYVLQTGRRSWRKIMPGSVFCAIGMLVVTMGYAGYTAHAVNNNLLYGSMASLAVLMFWFYFISWVMVLGILVNKVWDDTRQ